MNDGTLMPHDPNKTVLSILISKDDRDRLKAMADQQERSMSQTAAIVIREALDRFERNNKQSA